MDVIAGALSEQWVNLKNEQPGIRIRNAAKILKCTEVELLATQCGEDVIRLKPDFEKILQRIPELGYVMALTRNESVVHERKGVYSNWSSSPHAALFVGADIDLRIFLRSWSSAFAVIERDGEKKRNSLQFFGGDGEAVHKIYLTKESNLEVYESIIEQFKSDDQSKTEYTKPKVIQGTEIRDESVDSASFKKEWLDLQDTHDFYALLGKYRVTRTQALRLAPEGDYANQVENNALRQLLGKAVENQVPIMVFVANKGIIQIHTGEIHTLLDHHGWFNIMDPEFNLHVQEDAIFSSWLVRKPSRDGIITSLELFDKDGQQLVTIFGKRKPGIPELESWRKIVSELESENISTLKV